MNKLKSIKSLTKLGEEWVEAASIDMKNRLIKTDKKKRKPLNKRKKKTTKQKKKKTTKQKKKKTTKQKKKKTTKQKKKENHS